jgi:hypothetical protein
MYHPKTGLNISDIQEKAEKSPVSDQASKYRKDFFLCDSFSQILLLNQKINKLSKGAGLEFNLLELTL